MSRLKSSLQIANSRNGKTGRNGEMRAAGSPFPIIDRRASYGFSNTLVEAATQTQDREQQTLVDYDFHRTISVIGRRTLLSLGRAMFWKVPQLQAAVLEQAHIATVPFNPIYRGKNKEWGDRAVDWLNDFHSVMCFEGAPYDFESYCRGLVINHLVDGDQGTLLTEDFSGNARTQTIPSHRIGSRYQQVQMAEVRYEGNTLSIDGIVVDDSLPYTFSEPLEFEASVIDGVVLDAYSRALAYRVYSDPSISDGYTDISARNLGLGFLPVVSGQVRGLSGLASSVFDWQDWREWKRFETLAQKTFASKTIVEENETGDVDTAKAIVAKPADFDTNGNKTSPDILKLDKGAYTYFKAQTGSKLTAFQWGQRPGRDTKDFMDQTIRDAMRGMGWDAFFSLDPQNVGGAPMRVIVDRVNRTVRSHRRLVEKNVRRVDVYALAKAIKNGQLPMDPDWFRWSYQGQADLTADRRYDAQTDEMEFSMGWETLEGIQARKSSKGNWQSLREQREKEVMDKYERAKRISDAYGVSIQEAMTEMGITGHVAFSMARRDTADDALEEDKPKAEKPKNGTTDKTG